ncbi:MAG: tetratricopeptide repeat protein [Candidatus Anammoximicrobium sp.]|nr:tetratricopeptide repeat protein [Candidatus Anammoximicrobium sp.]
MGKPEFSGRPSSKDRPTIGRPDLKSFPGDRPSLGRPEFSGRPSSKDRPTIGRLDPKHTPGGRPIIGGPKPGIGGPPSISHRPSSRYPNNWMARDFAFKYDRAHRPGWGYGGPDDWYRHWNQHWYHGHVHHHHHGWYHGSWSGHWGNYWYVPAIVGATYWGLSALTGSWGYGYYYGYANPYYTSTVVAAVPAYDYSQPIVINNYIESGDQNPTPDAPVPVPAESPEEQAGYSLLDQARDAFKRADYSNALRLAEQAVRKVPNDPVVHEFNALCQFAQGRYQQSAAVLNALLAVAPGMDWTTLISLYSGVDEYTEQLRALEAHHRQKPDDSAAAFVLAYHYLICGHADAAKNALQRVVAAQPNDQVAKRMYEALQSPDEIEAPPAADAERTVARPAIEPKPEIAQPDEATLTTDLVGQWRAERDGNAFDLTIDDQGGFSWKSTPKGQPPTTIAGKYTTQDDALIMESADEGTMAGQVTSGGPDQFQFVVTGGPPGDEGLTFHRLKAQP